jgi:hypothetical protein
MICQPAKSCDLPGCRSTGWALRSPPFRLYFAGQVVSASDTLAVTALAPTVPWACVALVLTGAFSFVTLCSTTLQLHSSASYRGRIMALWVFVYIGTTPIGASSAGGSSAPADPAPHSGWGPGPV